MKVRIVVWKSTAPGESTIHELIEVPYKTKRGHLTAAFRHHLDSILERYTPFMYSIQIVEVVK